VETTSVHKTKPFPGQMA